MGLLHQRDAGRLRGHDRRWIEFIFLMHLVGSTAGSVDMDIYLIYLFIDIVSVGHL